MILFRLKKQNVLDFIIESLLPKIWRTETRALALRLASGPSFAIGVTKEMLNRELDVSLDTALELEAQAQAICMQHPDYREAYEAFVEKRKPVFE